MLEQLTTREAVTRIVLAAFQEAPGSFRLNLAMKEAERILQELREQEIAELANHYGVEMTGR